VQSEGVLLGEEVIRVMTNTRRMDPAPALSAAQTTLTCPGRKRLDSAREGTPGEYEDGDPVRFRLGLLRIGDIALCSVNAEIYTAIGQKLKADSPLSDTLLVTIANGRAKLRLRAERRLLRRVHLPGARLPLEARLRRGRDREHTRRHDPEEREVAGTRRMGASKPTRGTAERQPAASGQDAGWLLR
jgi:hypothetical protein